MGTSISAGGIRPTTGTRREREEQLTRQQIEIGDHFEDVGAACDRWLRANSRTYHDYVTGKIPGFLYGRGRSFTS